MQGGGDAGDQHDDELDDQRGAVARVVADLRGGGGDVQIPVATSTAKATQPTVSIPLSSRCRSLCGGLGPRDITALETVSTMTSPGW